MAQEKDLVSSTNQGIVFDIDRWSVSQATLLAEICEIIENEVQTCDYVNGKIISNQPLSQSSITSVKGKNEEFGKNLLIFSNIAEIYYVYGKDSLLISEELKLKGGDIEEGMISFLDTVSTGKMVNEDYANEKIFLKGDINFDDNSIVLKTERGDEYHRSGAEDDKILPDRATLSVKPVAGELTINLDEEGKFKIFGVETFIPIGPRFLINTTSPFEIDYNLGRHIRITPFTATIFTLVPDGSRLWLNADGEFGINEFGTTLLPGRTLNGVTSYDLRFGSLGAGFVDEEGKTSYEEQVKEIDGEIYIVKRKWEDVPTWEMNQTGFTRFTINITEGFIIVNEHGRFFISHEDSKREEVEKKYTGEVEEEGIFFIRVLEFGKDKLDEIKKLIQGE